MSELDELYLRWRERRLSATEWQSLLASLRTVEGRARWSRELLLDSELLHHFEIADEWSASPCVIDCYGQQHGKSTAGVRGIGTFKDYRRIIVSALALAACVVFAAVAVVLWNHHEQKSIITHVFPGGDVNVRRGHRMIRATAAVPLKQNDAIVTTPRGAATLTFPGEDTQITVQADSEVSVALTPSGKRVYVKRGQINADVAPQAPGRPLCVVTPQAEACVLGTTLELSVGSASTFLQVDEGKVKFTRSSDQKTIDVASGSFAFASANVPLALFAGARTNVLKNDGFETGDANCWYLPRPHEVTIAPEAKRSGAFGVKLIAKGRVDQIFDTEPGKNYAAVGYIRIDRQLRTPTWGGFRLKIVDDSDWRAWSDIASTRYFTPRDLPVGEWVELRLTFTAQLPNARLVCENFSDGQFEVSVDDFSVTRENESLARNNR